MSGPDPFEDLRRDAAPCGDCGGEGVIAVERREDGRPTRMRRCRCQLDLSQARRLHKVNRALPRSFRNMSLDRAPLKDLPEAAKTKIARYIADTPRRVADGHGLWLGGVTGTGKTAAACLVVQQARSAAVSAEFWPVPELLVRLARSRYDDGFDAHEEHLHGLLEDVPLLVLDDLSATKTTPWALEQLYVVINRRYNIGGGRATIITSDLDAHELARMFGRRTIRRLQDMTHFVNCDWPAPQRQAA